MTTDKNTSPQSNMDGVDQRGGVAYKRSCSENDQCQTGKTSLLPRAMEPSSGLLNYEMAASTSKERLAGDPSISQPYKSGASSPTPTPARDGCTQTSTNESQSRHTGHPSEVNSETDHAPQTNLSGWQDISTAPKDAEILVWNGRRRHVASWDRVEGAWVSSYRTTTKRIEVMPKPTQWHLLPAEPAATTEGSDNG